MKLLRHLSVSPCRILLVTILLCILITGCAPSIKTGTVLTEGRLTGIEMLEDGQLGRNAVELVVKLDDGTEVKAIWMEQGELEGMKGRRVEVEPGKDSKLWRVIRTLETDNEGEKLAQEAASPTRDPVVALLDEVKDVKPALVAVANKPSDDPSDFMEILFWKGGIGETVERVVEAHRADAAVEALDRLIQSRLTSITTSDALVCAGAAYALGRFGRVATPALPRVTLLKDHPNWMTKTNAVEAEAAIQDKPKNEKR